jgi:hypothetical protein
MIQYERLISILFMIKVRVSLSNPVSDQDGALK